MKKIFILDDNALVLESIAPILGKSFEVTFCRDIISAKRRIRLGRFDAIVLDLMMPTRGLHNKDEFQAGFSFYNEVVKNMNSETPVLFWTNLSDSSFIDFKSRTETSKNIYYLQKDNNTETLVRKIKEIVGENE